MSKILKCDIYLDIRASVLTHTERYFLLVLIASVVGEQQLPHNVRKEHMRR